MQRIYMEFLNEWLISPNRKPLVIRGARQVGKTWLVHHFAEFHKKRLVEINFEQKPHLFKLFASNEPAQILLELEGVAPAIDPHSSILFLDEIQVAPELIAKLRWFAEDMPELPVIAAGSLLEFVLGKAPISMPVGRINYMHLEPLSFEEFLVAHKETGLVAFLKRYNWGMTIPEIFHQRLMNFFKEYICIGGMPRAVHSWVNERSLKEISRIQGELIATYRDDFFKYRGRLQTERLDNVLETVPKLLGQKFVYSRVDEDANVSSIKKALDLLCQARVCHKVFATAANGLPLGAEAADKYIKVILLDVGLCSASLGLSFDQLQNLDELDLINKGGIAEQVVGQLLRTIAPAYVEPRLYYWQRIEKGASAEVDYVIAYRATALPIEVKAGSTGGLKSLHMFMDLRKLTRAVRINSDLPHVTDVDVKDSAQEKIKYRLFSIPFYLIGELTRLLGDSDIPKS